MTHKTRLTVLLLICLHGIVAVVHGIAHNGVNVWPSVSADVFIGAVIVVAPLVALYLLYMPLFRWGILLFLFSMLASFLFGVLEHFLLPGPDNIASTQPGAWQFMFRLTAILLALIEGVGTLVGAWLLVALKRTRMAYQRKM